MNMNNIYKNPIIYYIAGPFIVALWPILVAAVYLPNAKYTLRKEMKEYKRAESAMSEILTLDPARLQFADSKASSEEFDYAQAVQRVASLCGISPASYKLNSGIIIKSGEKKSQTANVSLKDIGIIKCSKFLSTIQLHWADIECNRLKLTKKRSPPPDIWDADFEFKYYY